MLSAPSQRKLAHDLSVCISVWEEGERMEICYQGRKIYLDTQTHAHTHTHTQSMWKYSRTSDTQNAQHFSVASECKSESESQREVEQRL